MRIFLLPIVAMMAVFVAARQQPPTGPITVDTRKVTERAAQLAMAQDPSLGDVARANKQKSTAVPKQQESEAQQKAAAPEKPKRRVFTNDDIATPPAPQAPGASSPAPVPEAERDSRKFKKGLTVAQKLKMLQRLQSMRSMMYALQREERQMRENPDKSAADAAKLSQLRDRIAQLQASIAKAEADLYE